MNESLCDLSESVVKLEKNVAQVEMLNGPQINYTLDTLPVFADGSSTIKFTSKGVVVFVPLKTVDDVDSFENMLEDKDLCNQVVRIKQEFS